MCRSGSDSSSESDAPDKEEEVELRKPRQVSICGAAETAPVQAALDGVL